MIYCFDLDGTLCSSAAPIYADEVPFQGRIDMVNRLFDEGHYIKIYTARGMTTGGNFREVTEWQLDHWGVKYHELIMGKPAADIYVDDKGISAKEFFNGQ